MYVGGRRSDDDLRREGGEKKVVLESPPRLVVEDHKGTCSKMAGGEEQGDEDVVDVVEEVSGKATGGENDGRGGVGDGAGRERGIRVCEDGDGGCTLHG